MGDKSKSTKWIFSACFGVLIGIGLGILIGHYGINENSCDTYGFVDQSQQIDMGRDVKL